jgi:hypothetical protein
VYQVPPLEVLRHPQDCLAGEHGLGETQVQAACAAKGCDWIPNDHGPWCQVRFPNDLTLAP